ncbi:hypothetical protein JL193_08085 [Polaribacter batillariae]|uniref:Uncharacterized protein n=1 Tax=Polaribacter batillariae TaxID=2808900 RepID=A0ABX7SY37_9FLAO|nr:hypothetical protein [Polaribacter batillariae]QTD39185.1 hypothetical protein JL193_08085 [Polaribacter batillariae]
MSTRIEYRNYTGIITEQQALISSNSYRKIYYVDDVRVKKEIIKRDGTLSHISHYLKDGDDEVALVEEYTKQNNSVSMLVSNSIDPYFVERERENIIMENCIMKVIAFL